MHISRARCHRLVRIRALFSAPFPTLLLDDVNDVNGSTQSRRFFFFAVSNSLSLSGSTTNRKVARLSSSSSFPSFSSAKKKRRVQSQKKFPKKKKKKREEEKKSQNKKKNIASSQRRSRIIIVQDGREGRRRRPPRLISRRTFVHTMTTKRTVSNPIVRIGNWREDEVRGTGAAARLFCGSCTSDRFAFEKMCPLLLLLQVFARLTTASALLAFPRPHSPLLHRGHRGRPRLDHTHLPCAEAKRSARHVVVVVLRSPKQCLQVFHHHRFLFEALAATRRGTGALTLSYWCRASQLRTAARSRELMFCFFLCPFVRACVRRRPRMRFGKCKFSLVCVRGTRRTRFS